jgi:hypothetical protein
MAAVVDTPDVGSKEGECVREAEVGDVCME